MHADNQVQNAIDLSEVDRIVDSVGRLPRHVIPILMAIQKRFNYLPHEALERVCSISEITPATISSVATFYSSFRLSPAGRHIVKVCIGTACHVKGAGRVKDAILRYLKVRDGSDTDDGGVFTVTEVACLGCCTLAPAVQIDEVTYGHLTPGNVGDMLEDFLERQKKKFMSGQDDSDDPNQRSGGEIRIALGSCCVAGGSAKVMDSFEEQVKKYRLPVKLREVACFGMCHQTPLVEVIDSAGRSTLYPKVDENKARGIVRAHFRPPSLSSRIGSNIDHMLDKILAGHSAPALRPSSIEMSDGPVDAFLGKQRHIATESYGRLSPLSLDEYICHEGFKALRRVLEEKNPDLTIEEITRSGLRGRGGAGFPTGKKWRLVRDAAGPRKFVVMNGDEGDPGAFMDRKLLESFPFRIVEGIIIAAFTVGAHEGELYIRQEYPLALIRARQALEILYRRGYLGDDILGSGFSLNLHVMEGAGAFVCGEETALLKSIEGDRGTPRTRPPYPAEKGLWGEPTLVNNVETYACVPWIVRNGPEAFARIGTQKSKGTKVFSLAGKIVRGGLIEVPMGITINEIVNDIGGGIQGSRRFKAVQIGGPSGGCIPASLGDIPVDFEKLVEAGAIMGSGGLVVLDDSDCMVDVAKYFLEFSQQQSCGKCTFCRIGTKRMLEILASLTRGKGCKDDLKALEELARVTSSGSLCGLGQTAPNTVLTTLRYFHDEYLAHVEGRCPALKCSELVRYYITDDCVGCTRCAQACPVDAIEMKPHERHEIDDTKCVRCNMCVDSCKFDAVKIRTPRR